MPSYQYRKSHCGDKTVVRSSYLHNGISYTGKMTSLYWIRALHTGIILTLYQQTPGHVNPSHAEFLFWKYKNIFVRFFFVFTISQHWNSTVNLNLSSWKTKTGYWLGYVGIFQSQHLCVDKSFQTTFFNLGLVKLNLLCCDHRVSFLLSQMHALVTHEQQCCYHGFVVASQL